VLLTDGCAAFRPEVHDATLLSLSSLGAQMTCAEATALLEAHA
jgi:ureidoacrylate peracid hydrolase